MGRHFLSYWSLDTATFEIAHGVRCHWSASNQFGRLAPGGGDTLWTVTCRDGELILLKRLEIEQVTDWDSAVEILGTDDVWEAKHVAIANPSETCVPHEIDISDLAPHLRFRSKRDRLTIAGGRVDPQQLQTMRELTAESVALLERRFRQAGGGARWASRPNSSGCPVSPNPPTGFRRIRLFFGRVLRGTTGRTVCRL